MTCPVIRPGFFQTFQYEVRSWPLGVLDRIPAHAALLGVVRRSVVLRAPVQQDRSGHLLLGHLHSFLKRDHGLVGLVLLYGLLWLGLRRSGVVVRDALALLGLITLSALSVSTFNSVFAAIVLAVAMGLDRTGPPGRRRTPAGRGEDPDRQLTSPDR
jgi:hypothetical protein